MYIDDVLGSSKNVSNERFLIAEEIGSESSFLWWRKHRICWSREGGREGGREAGREGGREGGRQGGREAGREGGREGGRKEVSVFI